VKWKIRKLKIVLRKRVYCRIFMTKIVQVRTDFPEEPSEMLIKEIKEVEEEIKRGEISPTFNNIEDAIKWLDDKSKKYVRDK
jgi:hypothetical protein